MGWPEFMSDFAAVTSADRSRGTDATGCIADASGAGVGAGCANAADPADAIATHSESRADANPLGKATLKGCGARGRCDIVELCPVIAFRRFNSGARRSSQARHCAPLDR